jgi:hypothetical protein
VSYQHPHTALLREWGYADIADAFEAEGSSGDSLLPLPAKWMDQERIAARIYYAGRKLGAVSFGSTLRPLIERMHRRYRQRMEAA